MLVLGHVGITLGAAVLLGRTPFRAYLAETVGKGSEYLTLNVCP